MTPDFLKEASRTRDVRHTAVDDEETGNLREAERALQELAAVFLQRQSVVANSALDIAESQNSAKNVEMPLLNMEAKYRALVEQIPAVVFMAYLDEGIGEAYVSPQIKAALGFSQDEWLEDPVRWYQQILAPCSSLQPALAAQGTDDFVGGLEAGAQEFDNVGAGYLALPAFS